MAFSSVKSQNFHAFAQERQANMWCLVSQPNNVVLEVEVDSKADGQECLDKVCAQLGIIEVDYFGLQFTGNKGELLWLNTRNRITRQVTGPTPYRFRLRVKFMVQPHVLLQTTTRHQFYLQLKQDFLDGRLELIGPDAISKMAALIAQIEEGDASHDIRNYQQCCPEYLNANEYTEAGENIYCYQYIAPQIFQYHKQCRGMKRESAEYRVIQAASEAENFGVEYHMVKDEYGRDVRIGVGPNGISLHSLEAKEIKHLCYPSITMATHDCKDFYLSVLNDLGLSIQHGYKLVSYKAANALYRCVTEKHSFYRCDTVRSSVSDQYSRDLKGALASLFNDETEIGKRYIFDIRRTCREVQDHARRVLYQSQADAVHNNGSFGVMETASVAMAAGCIEDQNMDDERMEKQMEAFTCRVCMDREIDIVFCPCGHAVCCQFCAIRLDKCPICRTEIKNAQQFFFPKLSTFEKQGSFSSAASSQTYSSQNSLENSFDEDSSRKRRKRAGKRLTVSESDME